MQNVFIIIDEKIFHCIAAYSFYFHNKFFFSAELTVSNEIQLKLLIGMYEVQWTTHDKFHILINQFKLKSIFFSSINIWDEIILKRVPVIFTYNNEKKEFNWMCRELHELLFTTGFYTLNQNFSQNLKKSQKTL